MDELCDSMYWVDLNAYDDNDTIQDDIISDDDIIQNDDMDEDVNNSAAA